jgi:hypothetical protein
MRPRIAFLSALLFSLLAACDGSGDKKLSELNDAEIRDLCAYSVELDHARDGTECGSDEPDAERLAECIEELQQWPSSCQGTRDQAEECLEAQAEKPCGDDEDYPECAVFDDCEGS